MPLLLAAFAAGIAAGGMPAAAAAACVVLCCLCAVGIRRAASLFLLAATFFCGVLATATAPVPAELPADEMSLELRIDEKPVLRRGRLAATATVGRCRRVGDSVWRYSGGKVFVSADTSLTLGAGRLLTVRTRVHPLTDSMSSYRVLMRARGYCGRIYINANTPCAIGGYARSTPRMLSDALQRRCEEKLRSTVLEDDELALCLAMAAGRRGDLDPATREAYVRSGAAHLLAVSGLHVGIVFILANLLLRWLVLLRHGQLLLDAAVVGAVWLYAFATGLSVSVIRAAVMFTALQSAVAGGSTYRSANILAATAMAMLAVKPQLLYDVGFQMSVAAVGAIIYWGLPIFGRLRSRWAVLDFFTGSVVIGLAASAAVLPLSAYWFGRVSIAGAATGPLMVLLGYGTVAASIAALLLPVWCSAAAETASFFAEAENRCVAAAAEMPFASFEWRFEWWGVALAYIAAIAVTETVRRRRSKKTVSLHSL